MSIISRLNNHGIHQLLTFKCFVDARLNTYTCRHWHASSVPSYSWTLPIPGTEQHWPCLEVRQFFLKEFFLHAPFFPALRHRQYQQYWLPLNRDRLHCSLCHTWPNSRQCTSLNPGLPPSMSHRRGQHRRSRLWSWYWDRNDVRVTLPENADIIWEPPLIITYFIEMIRNRKHVIHCSAVNSANKLITFNWLNRINILLLAENILTLNNQRFLI